MDDIAQNLELLNWGDATSDDVAFDEIARRVARTGQDGGLITEAALIQGVVFHPQSFGGGPHQVSSDWSPLERVLVEGFLGRLCRETYARGNFMGGALAVEEATQQPSESFFALMRQIGALQVEDEKALQEFWSQQVAKAHEWYRANDWSSPAAASGQLLAFGAGDEDEYHCWRGAHPEGFVANSGSSRIIIHRAACTHLGGKGGDAPPVRGRKICSVDRRTLLQWIEQKAKTWKPCGSCGA